MKIPFKVSARTARLIGRENVASAKGAIIELVKNSYDADSEYSIVYIDNQCSSFVDKISNEEYNLLVAKGINKDLLQKVYHSYGSSYILSQNADKSDIEQLIEAQKSLSMLYIIDNGEGMTRQIIEDCWMTIGTDNKARNYKTNKGRIKAGAKGIGRFALDKLGQKCQMITIFNPDVHKENSEYKGYVWNVDWEDFEADSKTLDAINAEIEGISGNYQDYLNQLNLPNAVWSIINRDSQHGTILCIGKLRDIWSDEMVGQLYDDLGVLVPPSDQSDYKIAVVETAILDKYGEVESSFCNDYDYKIEAHADEYQNVQIRVFRNEYEVETIPASFFKRSHQQNAPYRKEDFVRGYWETNRSFAQLIPGFKNVDYYDILSHIGSFDFTFYFLKRGASKKDVDRFYYKQNAYGLRGQWLDKFGGIKLFRDGFRVRPYGERGDSAFDWLGLGARKQKSPAGIAKEDGGYRVEVENVAGSIRISRLTNVAFNDKSSREGLQENPSFQLFKTILQGIISVFEDDRARIAREMDADDKDRNGAIRDMEEAEELAKKILANSKDTSKNDNQTGSKDVTKSNGQGNNNTDKSIQLLAALNEHKTQEIEKLKEEQLVLRALASSGLMLASFSHDLSKINITLNDRYDKIRSLFLSRLPESVFDEVEERKNPYYLLERAKSTDAKMQNWLNFATNIIRKDKRKRRGIYMTKYFELFEQTWDSVLKSRGIKLNIDGPDDLQLRVFEIDLDSIFYNLFSNSVDAFTRLKENRPRQINIKFYETEYNVVFEYEDSGPGLSSDIANPEDIFKPLFTTKRNSIGEEIGTGLGMWIVKLVSTDNDALIKLLAPDYGFGLQLLFPKKYK